MQIGPDVGLIEMHSNADQKSAPAAQPRQMSNQQLAAVAKERPMVNRAAEALKVRAAYINICAAHDIARYFPRKHDVPANTALPSEPLEPGAIIGAPACIKQSRIASVFATKIIYLCQDIWSYWHPAHPIIGPALQQQAQLCQSAERVIGHIDNQISH
jgi:hypothetical protein